MGRIQYSATRSVEHRALDCDVEIGIYIRYHSVVSVVLDTFLEPSAT